MRRLWERVVGFFKGVVLISVIFACLPSVTKRCGAQGNSPPIVVPGSWTTVNLSLPAMGEYEQPLIYETWWKEIGECEHVTVPLELTKRVHFIYVNAPTMIVDRDPGVLGFTSGATLTIYIVLPLVYTKTIVMHEMLHMLDYWNGIDEGKNYHPPSRFGASLPVCGVTRFYNQ